MDPDIEKLLDELTKGLDAFARAYLGFREVQSRPGFYLSVDDAKANATADLIKRGIPLPEITRLRIHAVLGIERAVEGS